MSETFVVLEQHIKLLKCAYVSWDDCEFRAPQIDPKRPYGNSDVYGDMAEIFGITYDPEEGLSELQEATFRELHLQTKTVLQIILDVGLMVPGRYTKKERYEGVTGRWEPIYET